MIFSEDKSTPGQYTFTMGFVPLTKTELAGDILLKWSVYYMNYPSNKATSPDFLVSVIDACAPHDP